MVKYDPQKHHRRSIRLKGYDYTQPGAYFVTICAQNRELLFEPPEVKDMIQLWWDKLPGEFPGVQTDAFVIMPNHIHGVLVFVGVDPRVDPKSGKPFGEGQPHGVAPTVSLADVVRWFKTMTTNEYIHGVKQSGWAPFPGKLWQRNYYQPIIWDDPDWEIIHQYIQTNPDRWHEDRLNPDATQDQDTKDTI